MWNTKAFDSAASEPVELGYLALLSVAPIATHDKRKTAINKNPGQPAPFSGKSAHRKRRAADPTMRDPKCSGRVAVIPPLIALWLRPRQRRG